MSEEETRLATNYAEKWEIQTVMEDALTNLIMNHPDDPMGFLYDQIVEKSAPPIIDKVIGREIIDSRGFPTIEVEVWGFIHGKSALLSSASAPSCDFCSSEDSYYVQDNSPARYHGKGTRQCVSLVASVLQPALNRKQFTDQREVDAIISSSDNTKNFKKIGANTALAASAAIAIASAKVLRMPLYKHLAKTLTDKQQMIIPRLIFPIFNIANGPISRVFLLPSQSVSTEDQIRIIDEIYLHYENSMHCPLHSNGCFPLDATAPEDILAAVEIAVTGGGHTLGDDVFVGFRGSQESNQSFWTELFDQSTVVTYVEDPLLFDDHDGWASVLNSAQDRVVVAMGLGLSSRSERMSSHLDCNAIVLRAPHLGTLSKLVDSAVQVDRISKRSVIAVSERETEDTWICDLAVAVGASMLELGSFSKGENISKINRLLEISRDMERAHREE